MRTDKENFWKQFKFEFEFRAATIVKSNSLLVVVIILQGMFYCVPPNKYNISINPLSKLVNGKIVLVGMLEIE